MRLKGALEQLGVLEELRKEILSECQELAKQELRALRKELGFSLVELGRALGYSAPYICKIERGQVPAGEPFLLKLRVLLKEEGVENEDKA